MTDKELSISEAFRLIWPVENAVKEAVHAAVREHKLLGNPIASWQDGRVVWIQPDEIVLPPEDSMDQEN